MSDHEEVADGIQEEDAFVLPLRRIMARERDHETVPDIAYSDPSNIMTTAQEMVRAVMQARPEEAMAKDEESSLSAEEIQAIKEEQQAVLDEMAAKMTEIQAHQKNREAQEIADEAMGNWDEELS